MSKSRDEVNRLAWSIIDSLPQYPVDQTGLAISGSPKSFPEIEEQLRMGIDIDCALSMFLHEFYQHRDPSFFINPPSSQLSDINRAAFAGIAEYLSRRFGYPVPSWTESPEYSLLQERDWFEDIYDQDFLTDPTIREYHLARSAPEFIKRNRGWTSLWLMLDDVGSMLYSSGLSTAWRALCVIFWRPWTTSTNSASSL